MTKLRMTLLSSVGAFAVALCGAAPAFAQESPPPSESSPPPPPPARHSSSGSGAGVGVGAALLVGPGGPLGVGEFVWDQSLFHLEGYFGFNTFNDGPPGGRRSEFAFGVGGWYHLHQGSSSDFSLGAAIGIDTTSGGNGPDLTVTSITPGAQVRVFLTSNVALQARGGFAFILGDVGGANIINFGGDLTGQFGFVYFFR